MVKCDCMVRKKWQKKLQMQQKWQKEKKLEKEVFDVSFKLKVLEEAKKTTNRAAGRKFGVDEASVRYWKKQENELNKLSGGKRLPGVGRKVKLPDMEELLSLDL